MENNHSLSQSSHVTAIQHNRILSIGLELACNRGLYGGIYQTLFAFENISPHQHPLQASSSPILRIQIWSIGRRELNQIIAVNAKYSLPLNLCISSNNTGALCFDSYPN